MLNPITADPKYAALLRDYADAPTLNEQASARVQNAKRGAQLRAWSNRLVAFLLCSPLHWLLSGSVMLITVRGRKSGHWLTTPVNYVTGREGQLYTTSQREHIWWRNLLGGAPAFVRVRGTEYAAFGEAIIEPHAVSEELIHLLVRVPKMAGRLHIGWTRDGTPEPTDLARAVEHVVLTRVTLEP